MTVGMPSFFPYGPYAILLSWPGEINHEMLVRIKTVDTLIQTSDLKGITGITPAYNSILLNITPSLFDIELFRLLFQAWQSRELVDSNQGVTHEISVSYDIQHGLDLEAFAKVKKMSVHEVITLHTSPTYDVHFIGFLPGFLYLGGLHPDLHMKRRSTPRTHVPRGSVAIGGGQTGIYPASSPGGWHILGHTSHELFNLRSDPPVKMNIGDKVRFIPNHQVA